MLILPRFLHLGDATRVTVIAFLTGGLLPGFVYAIIAVVQ
jgi:hypothetical protein